MSSARLPLALAVLGLAACAHTPSETSYLLPDIRHAAPIIVKSSDDVPAGYDDHVVISVNYDYFRQSQQRAAFVSSNRYYYHGHSAPAVSRPAGSATSSGAGPAPTVNSGPAMPRAPSRSGNYKRSRSYD